MAYETGTASSQQDLVEKLATFAAANGWTIDEAWNSTDRRMFLHKGTVYIGIKTSPPAGGGDIGFWHALDYSDTPGGLGQQPDDSGQGTLNPSGATNVTSGPRISGIGDGPYTAYHFFADGDYLHGVVEFSPGIFRHFSFGVLEKVNDWTGGEYMCAHRWDEGGFAAGATLNGAHSVLWDSLASPIAQAGTLHLEDVPGMGASSKWAIFADTASPSNDRSGQPRIGVIGGIRQHSLHLASLGMYRGSLLTGFVPMFPIAVLHRDRSVSPNRHSVLGFAPDARVMQMANFTPGQEFNVGADTWIVFPAVRKQMLQASGVQESRNWGIAYKKIT